MKELQLILETLNKSDNRKMILATVVDVVGSGYRRPGARMLIDENGFSIGTVSGGCLEADVLERAKKVLKTDESTVITYDTTKDENSVFGLNMGCRGIVRILLETIERNQILTQRFQSVFNYGWRQSIATVISSTRGAAGGRLFYSEIEQFDFKNLPSDVADSENLQNDLLDFSRNNKLPEVRHYQTGDDDFEIFFENINPPLNLLLFGAGFDAIPVIKFAKELGWRVTAIDHRAAYANRERLTEADEIILSSSEDLNEKIFQNENSVAVIMTHNYERDRDILRRLLDSSCLYVGALGPRRRTERLLSEISENFSEEQLKKLHAPIGLDIGAETPEEIAVAIIAEIKSVLANRHGGFLRKRQGSIYRRS